MPISSKEWIVKRNRTLKFFSSDKDLLEYVKNNVPAKKKQLNSRFLVDWAKATARVCLNEGKLEQAKSIGRKYKIELPVDALREYAIRNNQIDLIEKRLKPHEKNRLILNHPDMFEPAEHKQRVAKLAAQFQRKLKNAPDNRKLKVLTESIWLSRSLQGAKGNQKLSLEKEFLAAFAKLKDQPRAGKAIADAYRIFLGTGEANRKLLDKMMKMLPAEKRVITEYQVAELVKKIRVANEEGRAELLEEANRMVDQIKDTKKRIDFSGQLAFAFALIGYRDAVNQIAGKIPDNHQKAWTMLQCAKVYPPRHTGNSPSYSQFHSGGVF